MFRALLNPQADTCSQRHSDTVELVEEQIKGVRIWTVAEGNSADETGPGKTNRCELWNLVNLENSEGVTSVS